MKKVLLALLMALSLGAGITAATASSPAMAAPHHAAASAAHRTGMGLDLKGAHKTGYRMVNGKLKLITAYRLDYAYATEFGGLCYNIDDTGNSQSNGTQMQLWQCNNNNQQFWYDEASSWGDGSHSQFVNYSSGKCLDDTGGGGNGTKLQQYTCNGDANQAWDDIEIHSVPDWAVVESVTTRGSSGYVVFDNTNAVINDGNKIQVWTELDNDSQIWCSPFFGQSCT